MAFASRGVLALLAFAGRGAHGHGRLTVPHARNGGDNGAVGGGPGDVHAFGADGHTKYHHGICGNAVGKPQSYNKVGDVQATYTAGSTVEFKVVITAHHVGFFEFELCTDAGDLSENCFMQHRLLKDGCDCTCGEDATLSCEACDSCRRWWKPLTVGELSQSVTNGYAGPMLPGPGNLVPYEYIMYYKIPAGVKTDRGVLRWHYMTTNSCTSPSSSPEEFWNCADVRVTDAAGNAGPTLAFDNAELETRQPQDLIEKLKSKELTGVYAACPEDGSGGQLGVGLEAEYSGLCGEQVDGAYPLCRDLSTVTGHHADCSEPPDSGILCESECSDAWFQCHNGVAYTKSVPTGTKCKGNEFVLEAACAGYVAPDDPMTTQAPEPESTPTPTTAAPTTAAPTSPTTAAPTAPTTAAPSTTTEDPALPPPLVDDPTTSTPTAAPTPSTAAPAPTPAGGDCGSCTACLWSSGTCYTDVDSSYCLAWSDNRWCGAALVQKSESRKSKGHQAFLGPALIQGSVSTSRSDARQDEL